MNFCPVCKTTALQPSLLDGDLPVNTCENCGGAWVRANEYSIWLKSQTPGKYNLAQAKPDPARPVSDLDHAALCPDCGYFLRKYKASSMYKFELERCNHCNGVWLDKNEWHSLKQADLHDELHQVFTAPWQKRVQDDILAQKFDDLYRQRFGDADYEKIKEIRAWLQENPNRNTLLAFLMDQNPYTA